MKKRGLINDKRAVSIMVGYALLITFAIIMSTVVYQQIKSYAPSEDLECGDGVSMFIQNIECNLVSGEYELNVTLKNNGRFGISGYFIRGTNDSTKENIFVDLSLDFSEPSSTSMKVGNSIHFLGKDNSFYPNDPLKTNTFNIGNKIYSLEIVPIMAKVEDNKKRFLSCSDAIIHEQVNCRDSSLVGDWSFEGNAEDSSGNGNDGIVEGATLTNDGKIGQAYEFDGVNDYILLPDSFGEVINDSTHTLSAWFNTNDGKPQDVMCFYKRARHQFGVNSGRVYYGYYNTAGNWIQATIPGTWTTGNWHHLAATDNGNTITIFLDGGNPVSVTKAGNVASLNYYNLIGSHSKTNNNFSGTIDEVKIWNRALSPEEIEYIYDSEK